MVSAIVLAAGLSSRMGSNKLLLPLGDTVVLRVVLQNLLQAPIDQIIVVVGHESERIRAAIEDMPVQVVDNPDYALGMTTSIQAGVRAASGEGYMICLSDMPLVQPTDYAALAAAFQTKYNVDPGVIVLPRFNGEKGNPVIFSSKYRDAILTHKEMEGCKSIVQDHKAHIHWIDMETPGVLSDMDVPEAYSAIIFASCPPSKSSPSTRMIPFG